LDVFGNVGLLTPVRDYIDTLVHPSAQQDALTAARHRAFIAPRLLGSFAALAAFPVYVTVRGVPTALEVIVFAWLMAPILIAYFLSCTGQYENAQVLSSLSLTGLIVLVAAKTGGTASFAAIWLVIVPLEAALSASRRIVVVAASFAVGAAALLLLVGMLDLLPAAVTAENERTLAALGIISASLYATGLALGAEGLARTSSWLLYAEEERYRLLARNMTDVITRHGRNGAVLFASPAAESLFGARISELLGHGLFDRVHVADRPAYLTTLADVAAHGEARSVEFRVRCESTEPPRHLASHFIWIEMRCRPLDRPGGDRVDGREVVAVMRDISERKAQEQRLEETRAEAERANAAKSRFLATMSHELRTPLNAIIGFSELLLNERQVMLDPARRADYAQLINQSGRHLLAVVNGILDMSKIETGNLEITPETFRPGQVIANCCDLLALKAREAGLDLILRLPDDLPEIVADKRALNQILLNLLSNAIKFTEPGGKVTAGARTEGSVLVLTVADNGVGIGDDDLPRLGQPFFQARASYDRRHDGTGLGLSIVKGLVALHGGDLKIDSRLGEGTRVTIRLPVDRDGRRSPATPAALAPRAAPAVETFNDQVKRRA
jgi:cell cycle sensor histidine kinase DivJ